MGRRTYRCPNCDIGDVIRDEHLVQYDEYGRVYCLTCGSDITETLLGEEVKSQYDMVSDEYIKDIREAISLEEAMESVEDGDIND